MLANGTFSDINAVNPVYTPSAADIEAGCVYLVMHLGAAAPCAAVTDTMKLCISRVPHAFAGADAMICEGFTYTLSDATATHYTGLTWSTSGDGHFIDGIGPQFSIPIKIEHIKIDFVSRFLGINCNFPYASFTTVGIKDHLGGIKF